MTLQEIKDQYAVSKGHYDYESMILYIIDTNHINHAADEILMHTDAVMKIYARECLKLASMNAVVFFNDDFAEVNKQSITNEKNIIK